MKLFKIIYTAITWVTIVSLVAINHNSFKTGQVIAVVAGIVILAILATILILKKNNKNYLYIYI